MSASKSKKRKKQAELQAKQDMLIWLRKQHKINPFNFAKGSTGTFDPVKIPIEKPDYVSESGSKYWYTKAGLFRHSDHWADIGQNRNYWILRFFMNKLDMAVCGFCRWSDLRKNLFNMNNKNTRLLRVPTF